MSEMMVSAGEAARRLGVAPATIQRWVDSGVLHAERTPGGHRRIYVTELRRLIAASRPAALTGTLAHWFDVLMTGDPARVKAELIKSRQATGNWADTADEVASAIAEIGRRWEAGACLIFEEHAASEALRRATAACTAEMPLADGAPRAAMFTIKDERHTLGLSLSELVVAEAGWRPMWFGEGPPVEELSELVARCTPGTLIVSASAASKPKAVAQYQDALMDVAHKEGLPLVLAGGGAWHDDPIVSRIYAFRELREVLS